MAALVVQMRHELLAIDTRDASVDTARTAALESIDALEAAVRQVLEAFAQGPERALAVSVPMLRLTGLVLGGWLHAKAADVAARKLAGESGDRDFLRGKLASARFYATHVLPQAQALSKVVTAGASSVLEADAAII
jgi:hypothetical protein